jgi:anti-sigma regulatory factor (Ser/Thr protein kinase)
VRSDRSAPLLKATAVVAWRVDMHLSPSEIQKVDAVPALLKLVEPLADLSEVADKLRVVLAELYSNAVEHGLLGLASPLKSQPDGMEMYYAERQARLAVLDSGEVDLSLEQIADNEGDWLRIVCRDSGAGFPHGDALAAERGAVSELPFGRGLTLLRAMTAGIAYNVVGNEATVIVKFPNGDGSTTQRPASSQ